MALLSLPHACEEKDGKSYRNRTEAEAVVRLVVDLLRAVLAVSPRGGGGSKGKGKGLPHEIGVITPYKAQARLLPSLPSILTVAILTMALLTMAILTMALLTMALLTMALLTMAILTMALLTMALLTMAILTMALLTMALTTMALLTMALLTMALLTAALLPMPGKATPVTARSGVQPTQAQGPRPRRGCCYPCGAAPRAT